MTNIVISVCKYLCYNAPIFSNHSSCSKMHFQRGGWGRGCSAMPLNVIVSGYIIFLFCILTILPPHLKLLESRVILPFVYIVSSFAISWLRFLPHLLGWLYFSFLVGNARIGLTIYLQSRTSSTCKFKRTYFNIFLLYTFYFLFASFKINARDLGPLRFWRNQRGNIQSI